MLLKVKARDSYFLRKTLLEFSQAEANRKANFSFINTQSPTHQSQNFYTNIFSRLKSPLNLFEAKRLHALLIVNGFFHHACTDRVLGSQLVNVYGKNGCLQEAIHVFDKLPQKSNIAWNSLLRGFVDTGQFSKALEVYHLMSRQGFVPDDFTYPIVFKACCGLDDLELGRKVRDMILFSHKGNIFVDCAMIDFFAKCGSLNEAREVFENMLKRDLASWTAMICGCVQNGEWFEALSLFREMRCEGFLFDSVIVASVLPVCGRLEDKLMGRALHSFAIRSGFESDLFVSNALIDMYCRCSDTSDARIIFSDSAFKDEVTWGSLIAGYSHNCQFHESYQLFLEMMIAGIKINSKVAASILPVLGKLKFIKQGREIHGYTVKLGFRSDTILGSALIDMYCNFGEIQLAELIFRVISDKEITIFNSMIVGYSVNGQIDSALMIFRKIWDYNLRPNLITLMSILPICARSGAIRLGKEIHSYATRRILGESVTVRNSLIDLYCKCGYLELGMEVFSQMTGKNTVTYNTIISAHGIYGLAGHVFSFFEQMKAAKVEPNRVTFISLLSACSHTGEINRGWFLYNSMINDYRISPNMEHYACIVDLLGRAGRLNEAYRFIEKMSISDVNVLGCLLGACRIHNEKQLGERIGKQIVSKLKDPGHYILLSNSYASSDRWKDKSNMRRLMKEKGLVKKPGLSWIEIGPCIHTFHASERMHTEMNEIKDILEILLSEMKEEGYIVLDELFGDSDELMN
ncbi:hypothetical protein ACFE04_018964 [Oxalis oulophora]